MDLNTLENLSRLVTIQKNIFSIVLYCKNMVYKYI